MLVSNQSSTWNRGGGGNSVYPGQNISDCMNDMSGMQREINGIASNMPMTKMVDYNGSMNESNMNVFTWICSQSGRCR